MSDRLVGVGGGNDDGDGGFVNEGHGDNTGGLSGLRTQPSPSNHSERDAVETAASYTAGRFGDLPFAPQCLLSNDLGGYCVSLPSSKQMSYFLSKDYDGALNLEKGLNERVEEFEGEKKGLEELRVDREKYLVECGNGEMVRRRIINEYLPTFFHRLHQSAKYKRSLGEVFSLAIGKGFIDGVSIGRKDEDIRAILEATPNLTLLL
ncbi:hypothetical protein Tco_0260653 [Tanacetum coccineum]